ncbi:MAG: histone deacetylase [Chloroflexota bacterium]
MPTAYLYSDRFLEHMLPGHPERPDRLRAIMRALAATGTLARMTPLTFDAATLGQITSVHHPRYVETLRALCERGGGRIDADTFANAHSFDIARLAAGACIALADAVQSRTVDNGIALVRPPGHHATSAQAMGFCLLNNVAIAARHLIDAHRLERVLIVDYDVHHGNGTENIFYGDPRVLYVSTHQYPHYPGTGHWRDTGAGEGVGTTLNVPLPPGVGDAGYQFVFDELVWPFAERFRPQFVLLSAGFDAHHRDPLAEMRLSVAGYANLTRSLQQIASVFCGGKFAVVLEGGYDLDALGQGAVAVCRVLLGDADIPDPLGPSAQPEANVADYIQQLKAFHLLV